MKIFLQRNAAGAGKGKQRLGGRDSLLTPVNFQSTSGPYVGTCDYRHQPVLCRISFLGGEPKCPPETLIACRKLSEQLRQSFRRA